MHITQLPLDSWLIIIDAKLLANIAWEIIMALKIITHKVSQVANQYYQPQPRRMNYPISSTKDK